MFNVIIVGLQTPSPQELIIPVNWRISFRWM